MVFEIILKMIIDMSFCGKYKFHYFSFTLVEVQQNRNETDLMEVKPLRWVDFTLYFKFMSNCPFSPRLKEAKENEENNSLLSLQNDRWQGKVTQSITEL